MPESQCRALMREDQKDKRRQQIHAAAYELLHKKGYKATSMLAIAKRARASNETLYAWYGNKQNLFRTLIEENASQVAQTLDEALKQPADIEAKLYKVGRQILEVVTSEKAVALNRAAAADVSETGVLGDTLASAGREAIAPLLVQLFEQAGETGQLKFDNPKQAVETYLNLLIGDLQIRRAIGSIAPLSKTEIQKRARSAVEFCMLLFSP